MATYTNSPLVNCTIYSPNHSGQRSHAIDTITIHCMAGSMSIEGCGTWFANPSARCSSNYGIGSDGRIALYVDEANRSWATSSSANDNRAVTIEVANVQNCEPYAVTDAAYTSLIRLCADICQRNSIKELIWSEDRTTRMGHYHGCNMTVHRDYANKSCPGEYLYSHMQDIANKVNAILSGGADPDPDPEEEPGTEITPTWYEVTTQSDPLNVRSYPGSVGAIIGRFPKGEVVTATRRHDGWLYVTGGSLTGWCSSAYLTEVTPLPTEEREEDTMDIAAFVEAITPEQAACIMDKARTWWRKMPESEWASTELADAVKNGITDGTRPRDVATREEVAVMIERAL